MIKYFGIVPKTCIIPNLFFKYLGWIGISLANFMRTCLTLQGGVNNISYHRDGGRFLNPGEGGLLCVEIGFMLTFPGDQHTPKN